MAVNGPGLPKMFANSFFFGPFGLQTYTVYVIRSQNCPQRPVHVGLRILLKQFFWECTKLMNTNTIDFDPLVAKMTEYTIRKIAIFGVNR